MSSDRPELSVVVPTYNGARSLPALVERLTRVLDAEAVSHEIVVVNDGSPDDTWPVLEALAGRHHNLRAVDLLSNHGQARATVCGLAHARGRLVATMDDDLEQPPEQLPRLLHALEANPDWDAVVGSWVRHGPAWRRLGSWVHALADRIAYGTPPTYRHTTFRVMRRPVAEAIVANETRSPVLSPLLRRVTDRVHNVEVAHEPRPHGRSGFRMRHGVRSVLTNFMQGTTLPLRGLATFGMVCAGIAAVVSVALIARWVLGIQTAPGWTSTLLGVVFFGGAGLFGIGLLGEYLALVLEEVRRPPRWTVRRELSGALADPGERPPQPAAPTPRREQSSRAG